MNSEMLGAIEYDEDQLDIEVIMRQIRQYLAQKQGEQVQVAVEIPPTSLFTPQVYDELYRATQTSDKLHVTPYLTEVRIPVIGPVWQRLRSKLHELVIFYVNRLAEAMMVFNAHVVHALKGIVQGMDEEAASRIQRLEWQIKALERRLNGLEGEGSNVECEGDQLDVEVVTRQVRQHLAQKRGEQVQVAVEMPSTLFNSRVYYELHQVAQASDKLHIVPDLTAVRISVIGSMWQRLRAKLHELVIFYVNRLAEAQMVFNAHAMHALKGIVQDVDEEAVGKIQRIEWQVRALEERLNALEGKGIDGGPESRP